LRKVILAAALAGLAVATAGIPTTPSSTSGSGIGAPQTRPNLASYVSDEDYPDSAIRAGEQGAVAFSLTVGANGRVRNCAVTSSSGSEALDTTTCRIMRSRARFIPARDAAGHRTTDIVAGRIRWVLPVEDPPPADATTTPPPR
jgi:protein TonB